MKDNYLSISRKNALIIGVLIILIATAAFAAGYLYRGQKERAPIIIEKRSD